MNILLCCYEYPPIGGGGGVGAQQYAEAWAAQGHGVSVLTGRAHGLASREVVNGVDVIRVFTIGRKDRATSTFLSMLCYNGTALLYILLYPSQLKRFDIINTHFSIPTGPVATVASWILGVPNVLTIIGGDIYDPSKKSSPHRNPFMRAVNRWVIRQADRVIAISSDTKRRAQQYYGIGRPIEVINYGFKPRAAAVETGDDLALAPDKFYLIAVGRLIRRKGFEYLISAMRALPEDVVLLLIGDGPLENALRGQAAQEGVLERVQLLGFRTREQIYQYLRKVDCFVLPSLHEGLGIVVQEAMDAGLPVIATNNGGQVDLIKHLRNGILVQTESSAALADAIRTLYHDRALAGSMGRNNKADIEQFHIDRNSREYLEVFERVMVSTALERSCETA